MPVYSSLHAPRAQLRRKGAAADVFLFLLALATLGATAFATRPHAAATPDAARFEFTAR